MTLYINPRRRFSRGRMRHEMMPERNDDYSAEINFPIDVIADNDSFILRALLPGVRADDLEIQIVNESVTISGELNREHEDEWQYLLAECPTGTFYRIITLPTPLDANNISADLDNGILTVRIPKAEEAKPRTIKIRQK